MNVKNATLGPREIENLTGISHSSVRCKMRL